MSPTQLSYQRYDNFFTGEDLGELHHSPQILFAETRTVLLNQLSRRYDNLLAVSRSLFAENLMDDPFTDAPIEQSKSSVYRCGNALSFLRNELAKILDQDRRDRADPGFDGDRFC